MAGTQEIVLDLPPFIRVYKDGRVERFRVVDFAPSRLDATTGVSSKDVLVSPDSGVSVRLYLPPLAAENRPLPILFYIHGGAMCIESAFSTYYHSYLNSLVAHSGVVAVSVEYRLAPEHPIPAGYLDCWAALQWLARQAGAGAGAEPWLRDHGDFGRIFLAGDSAGANLSHNLAMAASGTPAFPISDDHFRIEIAGIVLVHPFFFGKNPGRDRVWEMVCGTDSGVYNSLVDLVTPGAPDISRLGCRRVLVMVAGSDFLNDRGRWYVELLSGSGWGGNVELVEHEGEDHVFHLVHPESDNAKDLMRRFVSFINYK